MKPREMDDIKYWIILLLKDKEVIIVLVLTIERQ